MLWILLLLMHMELLVLYLNWFDELDEEYVMAY